MAVLRSESMTSKVVGSIEAYPGVFQGKNKVTCSWKIKPRDFFSIKNTGESIKSPVFTCFDDENKPTVWQIIAFPKGNKQQDSKHVSVYLASLNSNSCEVFVEINIFHAYSRSITSEFREKTVKGFPQLIKKSRLFPLFKVEIKAQVSFIRAINTMESKRKQEFQFVNDQLIQDISKIMFNDDLSDCKILCEGQKISCHAVILAARSPVFAAMMSQPLKEKDTREICIEDFTIEIVRELVNFIYTGKMTNIEENAAELLKIAEKYQIQQMKDTCVTKLMANTNVENCLYYAELGILYRVEELKSTAVSYAVKNITELMKTQEWKQNSAKNPELLSQILEAMTMGNKPK